MLIVIMAACAFVDYIQHSVCPFVGKAPRLNRRCVKASFPGCRRQAPSVLYVGAVEAYFERERDDD
jgi:hypothetical protein